MLDPALIMIMVFGYFNNILNLIQEYEYVQKIGSP